MAFCTLLAAIVFAPSYASAQNFNLRGSVKTEKGEPIIGATVLITGTQQGVTTGSQGEFTLAVAKKPAADASIVVSYLGYKPQTIVIGSRTTFDVVLVEESTAMDEVVVVGYGTQKRPYGSTLLGGERCNPQPTDPNHLSGSSRSYARRDCYTY